MATQMPKQYLLLGGLPLIGHALTLFCEAHDIQSVHVILSEKDPYWASLPSHLKTHAKLTVHQCGGETRAQTVQNGLQAIQNCVKDDDWILVHDAARPGLTHQLLNHLIESLKLDEVGGLLALPLADTLKRADENAVVQTTVPRANLWQAQTPQMFRYALLVKALSSFKGSPTDEAEAIEALGLKPKLVAGALRNLKVTYSQDLTVLQALLREEST
jgi:2-C-methyl-D-erythritol 4-phosphate cytidylyltransferase